MKAYLWIPLFFFLGILIGGWGPRESLRELERDDAREQRPAARKTETKLDAFTHLANIPDEARAHGRTRKPATNTAAVAVVRNIALTNRAERSESAPPRVAGPGDLAARIDQAKELWQTRMEVAHTQWVQRLSLDGTAEASFDAVLNEMNERLYRQIETFAADLQNGAEITEEALAKNLNAFTAVLAETYDRLAEVLPDGKREEISDISLSDFIDPGVAAPLIEVQEQLGPALERQKNRKRRS